MEDATSRLVEYMKLAPNKTINVNVAMEELKIKRALLKDILDVLTGTEDVRRVGKS